VKLFSRTTTRSSLLSPEKAWRVERNVEVDTGESVAFSYELAGLGSRFLALLIDFAIQTAITIGLFLLIFFLFTHAEWFAGMGKLLKNVHVYKIGSAALIGLTIFAVFMLFFGYFILFEWLWNGRTPGKRVIGIRVVRDGGFPLDFIGSVIRNIVRVLESSLGFYLISGISALLSPQNKRLGDFAAGTIVVRDARFERYVPAKRGEREAEDSAVRDLSFREREIVRQYVTRRDALAPYARQGLAAEIATRIRPRLGANFNYLSDDELLTHLAKTAL
jgi:uncharacterized RDD family membrane protein YckC